MRSSFRSMLISAVSLAVLSPHAFAAMVSDGEFSSWTSTIIDPSSATYFNAVEATGGNPGARFFASINANGDNLSIANVKQDYVNTAALSGTWTMKMDYLVGPPGTNPIMGVALVIQQGSNFWYANTDAVVGTAVWQTKTITGSFNPALFQAVGASPPSPNFSAGTATKFGLMTYLNGAPTTYADYFDNWSLDNPNLDVPEPGSLSLLALTGVAALRRRRA